MRLNDFDTIDEIVQLGKLEFNKRATAPTIDWIPPRQNVYSSQCIKFSKMFFDICDRATDKNLIDSNINPSQFIKAAQDFQLAARMANHDINTILPCFMKLANIGMMLKRYNYEIYSKQIDGISICENAEIVRRARQLHGLLRALSEAIYFDDHTISGEFYGDIYVQDKYVVVRSYKRLCPRDLLDGFERFHIKQVETYSYYEEGKIDFDCLGNILFTNYKQPIMNGFYCKYYLDNDECIIIKGIPEMEKLINVLESQLQKVLINYNNTALRERQCLILNAAYYAFKPILEILNIDWHPTEEDQKQYIDSLVAKPEYTKVSEDKTKTKFEREEQINRIVDPRIKL